MAQPTVTCYAELQKPKSLNVLRAFAQGCEASGVQTATLHTCAANLEKGDGPVAFYGVRPAWMHLWRQAEAQGRDRYYLDNAWFDAGRERYFRVGVNGLQNWSQRESDGSRLKAQGIELEPWTRRFPGFQILICQQSDEFMGSWGGYERWSGETPGPAHHWTDEVKVNARRGGSTRPFLVRAKGCKRPLAEDLARAWIVIAHNSACAVEALRAGVPVIVTDPDCAAARFSTPWERIEQPCMEYGRQEWAERLADSQWTLEEMRRGDAWRAIHEGE